MPEPRLLLFADDDPELRRAVQRTAEAKGHRTVFVAVGSDVLKTAIDEKPDLIVLDISFPDADGRDVLSKLKADSRTAGIPVLVWSGRDPETDRRVAIDLGAEDYVEKAGAQTLFAKIERLLLRLEN